MKTNTASGLSFSNKISVLLILFVTSHISLLAQCSGTACGINVSTNVATAWTANNQTICITSNTYSAAITWDNSSYSNKTLCIASNVNWSGSLSRQVLSGTTINLYGKSNYDFSLGYNGFTGGKFNIKSGGAFLGKIKAGASPSATLNIDGTFNPSSFDLGNGNAAIINISNLGAATFPGSSSYSLNTLNNAGSLTLTGNPIFNSGNFILGGTVLVTSGLTVNTSLTISGTVIVKGNFTLQSGSKLRIASTGILSVTGTFVNGNLASTISGKLFAGNISQASGLIGGADGCGLITAGSISGGSPAKGGGLSISSPSPGSVGVGVATFAGGSISSPKNLVVSVTTGGYVGLFNISTSTGTTGYYVVRRTGSLPSAPSTFESYAVGAIINGSTQVVAILNTRTVSSFVDNLPTICSATNFYAIYAIKVSTSTGNTCGVLYFVNATNPATASFVTPSMSILTQPVSTTVCGGISTVFTVSASGSNLNYLWNTGATTSSINVSAVGNYVATVSGACGNLISMAASLSTVPKPVILTEPASVALCGTNSCVFTLSATGSGLAYQWFQSSNSGLNWISISDGGNYTGSQTPTLSIIGLLSSSSSGNLFRNVMADGCGFTLTSAGANYTLFQTGQWLGTQNRDWSNASNWCIQPILSSDNVIITNSAAIMPVITATSININNITIGSGASLDLQNANFLSVNGNFSNDGEFNSVTGKVEFVGKDIQTISGIGINKLYDVTINNPNGVSLATKNLTISGTAILTNGRINLNGNSLSLLGSTFVDQSRILGTGTVTSNGYFRTTNTNGLSGEGASIPNAIVVLSSNSMVDFASSISTTILGSNISPPNTFNKILISGGGTKYLKAGFSLRSNGVVAIMANNTLDGASNSFVLPNSATVSVSGTFRTSNPFGFSGNANSAFSSNNNPTISLLPGSTINYNGDTQTISSNLMHQNLTLEGTGNKILPNAPAVVHVQGDFTNNLTIGSISFGTSTVSLTGSNLQNIQGTGTHTFYNLNISKSLNPVSISGTVPMTQIIGVLNIQNGPSTALYTNDKLALISLAFGTVSAQVAGSLIDFSKAGPVNGSVNGKVIVQRATLGTDPQNRAYYISCPVQSNLDQIQSSSTNFYFYNEAKTVGVVASGTRSQLWEKISSPSITPNVAGRGYSVRLKGLPNYTYGTVLAPSGNVFNGDIDYAVSKTNNLSVSTLPGWNLLGNPYPSAIDLNRLAFSGSFNNVGKTFYVWKGDRFGTWTATSSTTGIGTNGISNIVGAMQGFFVQATAQGNVRFSNSARTSGVMDNKTYYRQLSESNPTLTLRMESATLVDEIKIALNPNVTSSGGFDPNFDAFKLNPNAGLSYIYSLKDNLPMALNSIRSNEGGTIIPLVLVASTASSYKIAVEGMDLFDPLTDIYFQDNILGTQQDLRSNSTIEFPLSAGTYANRFSVIFRVAVATGLAMDESDRFKIFSYNKELNIVSFQDEAKEMSVSINDVSGKNIWDSKFFQIHPGSNQIDLSNLTYGVYLVCIKSGNSSKISKLILSN